VKKSADANKNQSLMSVKVFEPRKLEIFLEKGRERGFVTYSEILSFSQK